MGSLARLSDFQAFGSLTDVQVCDRDGARSVLPVVTNLEDLRKSGTDDSAMVGSLTICCDFVRKDLDQQAADRLLARLRNTAAPPSGVRYAIAPIAGARPGVRIGLILTGSVIPAALSSIGGWQGFKYEITRRLFQFKRDEGPTIGGRALVDEELHERIRHVLRRITASFAA